MDSAMKCRSKPLLGDAGEFYAAAQRTKHEWDATLMTRNAPRTDIVARSMTGRTIAVQCKTSGDEKRFRLNAACEDPSPAGPPATIGRVQASSRAGNRSRPALPSDRMLS